MRPLFYKESATDENSPEASKHIIYTIGYGSQKWEEFISRLTDAGIHLVLDVRSKTSRSRSKCFLPQTPEQILEEDGLGTRLVRAGIIYSWWWSLEKEEGSQDVYQMDMIFLIPLITVLIKLGWKTVLLSAELAHENSHRAVLADVLVRNLNHLNLKVEHL